MSREQSLDELARLLQKADRGAAVAQRFSNQMQPTYGTITSVSDPANHGRIKVVLDEMNPEILSEDGFNQGSGQPTVTDWIDPHIPFQGIQPEDLIGKRVPVQPRAGDPNRLFFGDPVFDPGETNKAAQPKNSSMTRLPVYPSGSLPSASEENIGCMVIEQNGPMESDWLCVCLARKGEYYWVRHIDMSHGHAGEDDGQQDPDSDGDGEVPVEELTVWDYVFPTTHEEYDKKSIHGTDPRSNPFGGDAKWHGGA